jgi:beta-lactamase class D
MPRFSRVLAIFLAAASCGALPSAPSAAGSKSEPWVIVDYSSRDATYRVSGDAALLSQRFTPGTTLHFMIAAAALQSGQLTPAMEIPVRQGGMKLSQALRESSEEFFSQLLKRTGYEPVRKLLLESHYTPDIPEAVASFAELTRGEPLRVTVFEQNLFFQSFVRREIPVGAQHCASIEKDLALASGRPVWGQIGSGEISQETPRFVSWFNGAATLKDGTHVISVAVLTGKPSPAALDRLQQYLGTRR